MQVIIHTDTINESASVEDTVAAIAGRTIHAYHVEGAGGGHAPDLLEIVSEPNVLTSSTNPTNPFTLGAVKEHLDMIMSVHLMNPSLPSDVAFAQSRVRPETMAAEDVLHDMGAISMMGADSVGMGRVGESVLRTWQLAHVMKCNGNGGADPGTEPGDDNARVLRYLAKYTIEPAIAHGISRYVGSLETGKFADIVLWRSGWFGVKPEMVIKNGFITYANTGQGNGSTLYVEPMAIRKMFGSYGAAAQQLGGFFVSGAALDNPALARGPFAGRLYKVTETRGIGRANMVRNNACPRVRVDKESFQVFVDGREARIEAATQLPMTRAYWLL